MKPYLLFLCVAISSISILGCNKTEENCGCIEPPPSPTSWKITSITGGIAGENKSLTTDQQNNVLTLKPNSEFVCTNQQTGMIVNGTVSMADFASIYGNKPRLVFNPALPMLDNEFHIMLNYADGKLILSDNTADGYSTTFSRIQP